MRLREDARHDLTGGIVSSAHSAAVQPLLRADDSVAADGLLFKKKRNQNYYFWVKEFNLIEFNHLKTTKGCDSH
jgi:hypothetical protein